ncbi:MAG: aminopeptidase N C-terminal domain-containing protein, partial [Lautropia mirabilis]
EQLEPLDPSLLRARRLAALRTLVQPLVPYLQDVVARQHWRADYSLAVPEVGQRALANTALQLLTLVGAEGAARQARAQFEGANNLTDRLGALQALVQCARMMPTGRWRASRTSTGTRPTCWTSGLPCRPACTARTSPPWRGCAS